MEQLALHIEYLLLRHDCVILPGFGAFINTRSAARYDKTNERWIPMTREVRFNPAVNQDDGLITNSYARKYSLSFQDARILLNSDIKELNRLLETDSEVTLDRIGTLSRGEESTLLFSPIHTAEQISRELGFVSVPNKIEKNNQKTDSDTPAKASSRSLDFDRNYYIPVNKTMAKVAASIIAVLIVAISVLLPSSGRSGEDRASVVPVKVMVDSPTTKDNSKTPSSATREDSVEADSEIKTTDDQKVTEAINNISNKYYLIVGTFSSEKEARKYIDMNKGINQNLILVPSKTLVRVASAASNDKSELITELNSDSFKSRFPEGWIWENK